MRLPISAYLGLGVTAVAGLMALSLTLPPNRVVAAMFDADGQYELAIDYYRAWTRSHPGDWAVRWRTAELEIQTVRPQDAVSTLSAMAKDWPRDPRPIERLVAVEDSLLHVDASLPWLERLTELKPLDAQVARRLADQLRWRGESERLLETLRRVVRLGDFPEERSELIDMLLSARRYSELIAWLGELLHDRPDQVELRLALHEAYLRSGRIDDAIAELHLVLELEPTRIEHLRDLADLLIQRDRWPEALALYRERLERDPRDPSGPTLVAELSEMVELYAEHLAGSGHRDQAIALYRGLIKDDPRSIPLRLALANLYGKAATRVAVAELRTLIRLQPNRADAWTALGERLGWLGDMPAAVRALQVAQRLMPASNDARRLLAQHLVYANREPEAIVHYRALVAASPNTFDRAVLIELLIDGDAGAEALRVARALMELDPRAPRHRLLLGLAAASAGECAFAVPELRAYTQQHGREVRAWHALGVCATEVGQPDLALAALRQTQRVGRVQP